MTAIDPGPVVELQSGAARVELRPAAGGRIGQIDIDGMPLLRGYDDVDVSPSDEAIAWALWGCYLLAPWANRVRSARFRFEDEAHRLVPNWPDGTAIHGLVANVPWDVRSADEHGANFAVTADIGPFQVRCEQRFTVADERLRLDVAVTNVGQRPVPVGLGIHPWFRAGSLALDAAEFWPTTELLPVGPPRPVGGDEDLRRRRRPPVMDRCYTGIGRRSAVMDDLDLTWTPNIENVVVYTGTAGWMCVEPMTHAVDGFNLMAAGQTRHGVVVLGPRETLDATFGFEWRGVGSRR